MNLLLGSSPQQKADHKFMVVAKKSLDCSSDNVMAVDNNWSLVHFSALVGA